MKRYAYAGAVTGELLSYQSAVLWHDNPAEMEFIMPGQRVVPLPPGEILGRELMRLRDHPGLAAYQWPLDRGDFRA